MSVGILIISHDGIGETLLETANHMIVNSPLKIRQLPASRECDPDDLFKIAKSMCEEIDDGDGILVLTDLIGSTPSNIAYRLAKQARVNIITGLNLSMLIRLFNYPDLSLSDMTDKAYSGGIDGITISFGENNEL
ncbi:MAG: PTS fructose transporter subunit IIA [Proteobacteria bacterium]|nr:PTS fructose transporter subunit IIA [Pseudomonadota bacterium]NOG60731.1 PTS fructose transporter subunit IIA [Pseudomonadota bacterium]